MQTGSNCSTVSLPWHHRTPQHLPKIPQCSMLFGGLRKTVDITHHQYNSYKQC